MKRKLVLAIVLVVSVLVANAQQKRAMTLEDVIGLKAVSDPQISPDGRWVAYVVTSADLKEDANDADLWLVSTSGGEPIRLTTSKKNDTQPRWAPDGKQIAFVSAREQKPQIFIMSPFGGEAERLTQSKTGVQSFQWSPDGSRIAYVVQQAPNAEEEKKQKEKDDAQVIDEDFKQSCIWVIDVKSRKETEVVTGDFSARDPEWSPDGSQLAFVTTPTPKADDGSLSDIRIIDVASAMSDEAASFRKKLAEIETTASGLEGDSARKRDLQRQIDVLSKDIGQKSGMRKLVDNDGPDTAPRWSPDGKRIAYLSRDSQHGVLGQLNLNVIASTGGTPGSIAPNFEYQPGPARWTNDGKTLFFTSLIHTTPQLFSVPAEGGEPRQLSNIVGVIGGLTFSRDGLTVAFTRADVQHPDDVYASKSFSLAEPTKLTDHNPQLRDVAMGRSEVIRWKGKDGLEIEGLLIYPVNYESGKRYPTMALIHGGPSGVWAQGFPGSWGNFGHVWAGKGWLVFYPNIRGSSGYGEKFLLANVKDWGGGDYQDIQTGLDYLVARGIADPERMGQSGWSYGGYMTAWTLTQTNRFKAVMVGAGLTNMYSMYSTNDLQRILEGYFGGEPWDNLDSYWNRSAMAFIKQAKTPTLILHGGSDTRVPPGQAKELYMGLRKNGVPVEMVVFPREPHGLQEPRHRLDKMRREYAWFSKHVLGVEFTESKPAPEEKKPVEKPAGD